MGGGAQADSNLFHSFSEFSVAPNQRVYFANPTGINRILSRVTGSSVSNILGTLGVDGSADLFLLNPNGIYFGSGATLDISGSFFATTANALRFEDGTVFSTVPAAAPILTVSVPAGLQFGAANPASITVEGNGNQVFLLPNSTLGRFFRPQGLAVAEGKTLGLLGGNVNFTGGNATAPNGNLEVAGLGANQDVGLKQLDNGTWQLDYSAVNVFQDVNFREAASLDVSGTNADAGQIQVRGRAITIADGSSLMAQVVASGNGEITVQASDRITFSGKSTYLPTVEPFASANIATLPSSAYVETGSLDPVEISSQNPSRLSLIAPTLSFSAGAQAGLGVAGTEESGTVFVKADLLEADGDTPSSFSGLYAAVLGSRNGTGSSGTLTIDTDILRLTNGAQILNSTFGPGDAGSIRIQGAQSVEVVGLGVAGPSSIQSAVETPFSGSGGSIQIETDRLLVADGGQISTSTKSTNPAGNLTINARESIELRGQVEQGRSGLFASALSAKRGDQVFPAEGAGGNILITTGQLQVLEGATINVSNKPSNPNSTSTAPGLGTAGNLTIVADTAQLNNALITAETVNGNTANISMTVSKLSLAQGSQITTNATGQDGAGGSITINSGTVSLRENSLIAANAAASAAGNISITATDANTLSLNQSRITAEGGDGNIFLRSPRIILTNQSLISANGLDTAQGGNILLLADFLVGLNNSDITANAQQGPGGRVVASGFNSPLVLADVTASSFPFSPGESGINVIGIQPRERLTGLSDITVTSELGSAFNGSITINTPEDGVGNIEQLAGNPLDPARLVAAACNVTKTNQLASIGRGGLPMIPDGLLSSVTPWEDLRAGHAGPVEPVSTLPTPDLPTADRPQGSQGAFAQTPEKIVEAQGLMFNTDGQPLLVSAATADLDRLEASYEALSDACDQLRSSL